MSRRERPSASATSIGELNSAVVRRGIQGRFVTLFLRCSVSRRRTQVLQRRPQSLVGCLTGVTAPEAESRLHHIFASVKQFTAAAPPHDDVTAMVVSYRSPAQM